MQVAGKIKAAHIALAVVILLAGRICCGEENKADAGLQVQDKLLVVRAKTCEEMSNLQPVNQTTVFSVTRDKAFCFAEIEGIEKTTHIYHNWIRRDNHVAGIKLVVKPPRWSTVSSISLRETDKGPWRVEIEDMNGKILKILRFSVVD